jgi:tetratricopeptide (TPR) repeat protein
VPPTAESDLTEVIRRNPDESEAYFFRGLICDALGLTEKARDDYDTAIQLGFRSYAVYYGSGLAGYKLGDFSERTTASLEKACLEDPENSDAPKLLSSTYSERGSRQMRSGMLDSAIESLTRAIIYSTPSGQRYSYDPVLYLHRGNAYQAIDQWEKSLVDYNIYARMEPYEPTLYNNRGNTHKRLGNIDAAISDYSEAIRSNPEYARAFYNRGQTYFSESSNLSIETEGMALTEMLEKAIEDFTEAILIDTNYMSAYRDRGTAFMLLSRRNEALMDFNAAIQLIPDDGSQYNNMSLKGCYANRSAIFKGLGDFSRARADMEKSKAFGDTTSSD